MESLGFSRTPLILHLYSLTQISEVVYTRMIQFLLIKSVFHCATGENNLDSLHIYHLSLHQPKAMTLDKSFSLVFISLLIKSWW